MDSKRVLGLIPAKGGSTRLPRKNVMPLDGKPLLFWASDALKKSKVCDRIVVSTDDLEIAELARKEGLDVPFIRPERLAHDPAGVSDVALHCLQTLREDGAEYDTLIITLPTSPFRSAKNVYDAYQDFVEFHSACLLSVSPYEHTPFAAMRIEEGVLSPWFKEFFGRKSQEMPPAYRPNGAVHILDVKLFETNRNYFFDPIHAYVMQWPSGIDIDTYEDFSMARAILKAGLFNESDF